MSAPAIGLGVALYSYGGDFCVTMTLDDCLADVADMGATEVEILADTHIPGYPEPAGSWVEWWHEALGRHSLTPTCYSCWLDTRLHAGRGLTPEEAAAILERDVRLAHRLGFSLVRPKLGVVSLDLLPDPIWRESTRRALPVAAELGVRIAPEIHAPTPLRSQIVDDYLAFAEEEGKGHFGLLIDTGIFQAERRTDGHGGGSTRMVFGDPSPELAAQVAEEMSRPLGVDPAELVPLMPHVLHVHAKFWDMTDELTDPQTPYDAVVDALVAGGYRGSLSSEYEGPRDLYRASDMLRRQQAMLRRLLGPGATRP